MSNKIWSKLQTQSLSSQATWFNFERSPALSIRLYKTTSKEFSIAIPKNPFNDTVFCAYSLSFKHASY